MRSRPAVWCTATSSPPTSCSLPMAAHCSQISVSRMPPTTPASPMSAPYLARPPTWPPNRPEAKRLARPPTATPSPSSPTSSSPGARPLSPPTARPCTSPTCSSPRPPPPHSTLRFQPPLTVSSPMPSTNAPISATPPPQPSYAIFPIAARRAGPASRRYWAPATAAAAVIVLVILVLAASIATGPSSASVPQQPTVIVSDSERLFTGADARMDRATVDESGTAYNDAARARPRHQCARCGDQGCHPRHRSGHLDAWPVCGRHGPQLHSHRPDYLPHRRSGACARPEPRVDGNCPAERLVFGATAIRVTGQGTARRDRSTTPAPPATSGTTASSPPPTADRSRATFTVASSAKPPTRRPPRRDHRAHLDRSDFIELSRGGERNPQARRRWRAG